MTRRLLLLRAVNVGGHGKIGMADLRAALAAGGFGDVRTHIQSGNVVLDDPGGDADVAARAGAAIAARFGAAPDLIVLAPAELDRLLADCPFAEADPSRVVALIHGGGAPDATRLDALARPSEAWVAAGRALWLSCPEGLGRSKLAAGAEAALPGSATARNLRTLRALREMGAA